MWLQLRYDKKDLMKLHGYGCYCLNLGDRPLSSSTYGVDPRDEIDQLCRSWTRCNKCSGIDIDGCTPETKGYTVSSHELSNLRSIER